MAQTDQQQLLARLDEQFHQALGLVRAERMRAERIRSALNLLQGAIREVAPAAWPKISEAWGDRLRILTALQAADSKDAGKL